LSRWQSPDYARIENVAAHDGAVGVSFRNGDCVSLPVARLLPPGETVTDWSSVQWTQYDFSVPTASGRFDVPWDRVRVLTDAEFSRHMAEEAAVQARSVGARLRALRRQRGLSAKALAARAGISPVSLSRIETGRHDVVLTTLQRLLAAMGCSLHDIAAPLPGGAIADDETAAPEIAEDEPVTVLWPATSAQQA
jgi:transcriptional regulator with XRE-family HTH domain